MIGIYKFENMINHKIYIGQSRNIERRYKDHITRALNDFSSNTEYNSSIHKAIRKYGINNFSFSIIEECNTEDLNDREIYWISFFDSYRNGYNQTIGGNQYSHSLIPKDTVNNLIKDLMNTSLTYEELHKKYNISTGLISEINNGKSWRDENLIYPLRIKATKKITLCKKCNKKIDNTATYCSQCLGLLKRKVNRPDRDLLKEKIRNQSFVSIGKQYGVSDNAIKKWCDDYNLPRTKKEIKKYSNEEWKNI